MLTSVLARSVAERTRSLLWFGFALAAMTIVLLALFPSIRTGLQDYADSFPEAFQAFMNIDEMGSIGGFLQAELFSLTAPLIVIAAGIVWGGNAIAGEEDRHTLPLLLGAPISRARVAVEKLVATLVLQVLLAVVLSLSIAAGLLLIGETLEASHVAAAVVHLLALGTLFTCLAFGLGTATGRRTLTLGVTSGIAVAAWIADGLSALLDGAAWLAQISPFSWAFHHDPLVNGIDRGGLARSLVVAVAAAAASIVVFRGRDIRT